MLTRIWQHRYQGFLATCLLGVAAAILVMLLPDRQQAFARFALSPSAVTGNPMQTLLDDPRIVNGVLQQIEVEPPNPIDPRPVEPADAFKRNFGLRSTSAADEYEISYVGRTNERALAGVSSWMRVASQLYGAKPDAAVQSSSDTAVSEKQATLRKTLSEAQEKEQSLNRRAVAAQSDLDQARARLGRLELQLENAQAQANDARAARDQARQAQQRESQLAAQERTRLNNVLLTQRARAELAVEKLAGLRSRLEAAKQQASNGGASATPDPAVAGAQAEIRLIERQSSAVRRELAQLTERSRALVERLSSTPEQITEVVSEPAPAAPADTERAAALAREKATLAELRIRFTDNHPDVRRQLAIIADLESPGQSAVSQAPTIGARSVTRANPVFAELQAEQSDNDARAENLRQRLATMETSRRNAQAKIDAASRDRTAGVARSREQVAALNRQVATAEAELAQVRDRERAATDALAALQATENEPIATAPADNAELTALSKDRQALSEQVARLLDTTGKADEALATARQETARLRQALAELAADPSTSGTGKTPALALAGLQWVQGPQVVPALSNPYRPQWLLAALAASLLFGLVVALLFGLRRTTFRNLNELERITGLRALGAAPRFAASGRWMRGLVSFAWFALLLVLYVLIYLTFIAMVERGDLVWPIDWPVVKTALLDVGNKVATHLDIETVWLNIRSIAR